MSAKVELVPLVCTHCNTPIPARPEETAWVCSQCKQGWLLQEDEREDRMKLLPLDVYYQAGIPAAAPGWPFWVVDARVTIQRSTFGGNSNAEAQQTWSQPRRFFVPAYACKLDHLVEVGHRLMSTPPLLQPGPASAFQPVVLATRDIQPYVEFIVMAIEISRKDKLKNVDMTVSVSQPALWVLAKS